MPVGQPGHCALIWAKPNNEGTWDWTLYNDVGGITKAIALAWLHTPWEGAEWMEKTDWMKKTFSSYGDFWIWPVFAYNYCLTNVDDHIKSVLDNFDPYEGMIL